MACDWRLCRCLAAEVALISHLKDAELELWRLGGAGIAGTRDGLVFVQKSGRLARNSSTSRTEHSGLLLLPLCSSLRFTSFSLQAAGQAPREARRVRQTQLSRAQAPGLAAWVGLRIAAVQFRGVAKRSSIRCPARLALQPGRHSMWSSCARVCGGSMRPASTAPSKWRGRESGDEVTIIFAGEPRVFIGRVYVDGVKSDRLASQIGARREAGGRDGVFPDPAGPRGAADSRVS